MHGTSEEAYNLKIPNTPFTVKEEPDTTPPEVNGKVKAYQVKTNTAMVRVNYNEVVTVHYAVTYKRTKNMTSEQIINRIETTKNPFIFGTADVDINTFQANFQVSGLRSNRTKYVVFVTAVDQSGNVQKEPKKDNFRTKKNYRPASCFIYMVRLIDCA
jgi:hypothetical protein